MGRVTKTCLTFLRIVPCENPDIFLCLRLQNLSLQSLTMKQQNTSINSEVMAVRLVNINLLYY